jgi:type I restriction enzyme R subunit
MKEKETRDILIDSWLARAGWAGKDIEYVEEFFLKPSPTSLETRQFPDYVLFDKFKKPLAIVEAKRTERDALAGKRQAADYADIIKEQYGVDPFIFLTNGIDILFWDRGRGPERKVNGFYSREDLERMLHQREYSIPLSKVTINESIAGRSYQKEAIRKVTEGIEALKRKFLLVMATGTGKTRTVVSIMDVMLRAKRAQRILFLADRRELVKQAIGAIKEHLPNESISKIESGEISHGSRIHVATYPSMMQVYTQLSAGYYDLIVADESHRSIYNRYKGIFERFDSILLGLTATPTDYIDHNTFQLFECEDGNPTFYYSFEEAVKDKNLVNFKTYHARTGFQLEGIRANQLSLPLLNQLKDSGVDLDEIDFDGSDLEKKVSNTGTNDAIVIEFIDKCRKDILGIPHKTIIFAISHNHAVGLYESFRRKYPDYVNRGMVEIIDSHMEKAELTLDDFKTKDMPRIAISVDMLDTGIDVPSIQNLVFAKPVFSKVKFWQMIGRGTRLYIDKVTGEIKIDFLIMDLWDNFDYFQLNPEGEIAPSTEPLPVKLFRTRLDKYRILYANHLSYEKVIKDIQEMLQRLPFENNNVKPHYLKIQNLLEAFPAPEEASNIYLTQSIAPLFREYGGVSLLEIQFRIRVEKVYIAWLEKDTEELIRISEKIKEDLISLATTIKEVKAVEEKLTWMKSIGFWENLNQERLEDLQETFAPLMKFRKSESNTIIQLNLPDQIKERKWIIYGPSGEGAFADSYKGKVEARIKQLTEVSIPLKKLKQGEILTEEDRAELEKTLNTPDLYITEDILQKVYDTPEAGLADFLNHILDIHKLPSWDEKIRDEFERFISEHNFSASQIQFLRAVRSAVLNHAKIQREDFNNPPLSRAGKVEILFTPDEIEEILKLASKFEDAA